MNRAWWKNRASYIPRCWQPISYFIEIHYDLENPINQSVFPGHQGGPHNHTIGALAVALKQAQSPLFKEYQGQVLKNNKAFADAFVKLNYELVSGGTDNHLLLVNLKPKGVDGARVERVLELVNIAANKNTVPGDTSALRPNGLRIGTPAMTSRGFKEEDFVKVANYIDRAVTIAVDIQKSAPSKLLKDFKAACDGNKDIEALKTEITAFSSKFPLPSVEF